MKSEPDRNASSLEKVGKLITTVSVALVSLILGLIGHLATERLGSRELELRTMELAVDVLRADPERTGPDIREGAGASRFLDEVVGAAVRPDLPFHVVVTVRGDQYHCVAEHNELAKLFQERQVNVSPMTPAELGEAIVEPAKKLGVAFEDGLAARIRGEVTGEPGALPLLGFLLEKLWTERDPVSGGE